MKKNAEKRSFLASPKVTAAMFILAAGLLLFSSIGGARAALTYVSDTYQSRMEMSSIGVSLLENGNTVAWRDYNTKKNDGSWNEVEGADGSAVGDLLLSGADTEDEAQDAGEYSAEPDGTVNIKPRQVYEEELRVQNTGSIGQYVRVTVYKYWMDESGTKLTELSPELIELHFVHLAENGGNWILDKTASTEERTVLYYDRALGAGNTTPLFADTLTIDTAVKAKATQETTEKVIKTTYEYDGVLFGMEVKVDAVQDHSAADAIKSAWGRDVRVDENGILRLVDA